MTVSINIHVSVTTGMFHIKISNCVLTYMDDNRVMRTKVGLKRYGVRLRKLQLLELYGLCCLLHVTTTPQSSPSS